MERFISRFLIYMTGLLSGLVIAGLLAVGAFIQAPSWLVVDGSAHKADIAVVLGGGGGSRLRKGLSIYDAGLVGQLVLVDTKKQYWKDIQKYLCPECITEGKNVAILDGSTSTYTDAQLVSQYIRGQRRPPSLTPIKSLLVVTDPYHTRRALLNFKSRFRGSGVTVSVVSSGDFGKNLPPDQAWWNNKATAQVVWGELSKIAIFYLRAIPGAAYFIPEKYRFKGDASL